VERYFSLLGDDSLVVHVDRTLMTTADAWLPLNRREIACPGVAATITLAPAGHSAVDVTPNGPDPLLRLGDVSAFARDADTVVLDGSGACGRVSLAQGDARIEVATEESASAYMMLTLSAALLLGRAGAALVHAGSVVDRTGRAWLLVGDTHAGKTTTSVSLADAGWRFLADDQVVLRAVDGAIVAEGWPRQAHLDSGYDARTITARRDAVDVRQRWDDYRALVAPVRALLLPTVSGDLPTAARPVVAAEALAAVVRQSPWLMADRVAAPKVLAVLQAVATGPAFALTLGRDSYGNGALLDALLNSL
jgi:hypothetical protein